MKIIRHTASIKKNEKELLMLLNENSDELELDFCINKEIPIWRHNKYEKSYLSLYDILEINKKKKKLLIDLKNNIIEYNLIINLLKNISNEDISLQSTNLKLISFLKERYKHIELGLVINLFSRNNLNRDLSKLDFLSLSSELWEITNDYKKASKIKRYAWSWDAIYKETDKRIKNYIRKKADGIIVNDIEKAKKLIKM